MTDTLSTNQDVLAPLLERLRADGGRYLLSVALTSDERNAQEAPTYGSKGHRRWLTDGEYAALCSLESVVEPTAACTYTKAEAEALCAIAVAAVTTREPEPIAWMFDRRYGSGLSFVRPNDFADEEGNLVQPTPLYRRAVTTAGGT